MRAIAKAALCFLLLSCSHFRDTTSVRFQKQEDVGAVHVAVQSVAPFEGYINSLQPKFEYDTNAAIAAAIQQTQTEESQLFRALMASLSIAGPQTAFSKTKTIDGETTTAQQSETTTQGDLSKVTAAAAAPANTTAAASLASEKVALDQSLTFRAAAALLQEVTLLNAYVRDAAISRGARPYVVRMLVTLFPNARLEPYDAYSTISFFETPHGDAEREYLRTSGFNTHAEEDDKDIRAEVALALDRAKAVACTRPLEVIPLVVTDNLESSLHSDAVQRIRDLSAALQGFNATTAVGANVRSRAEDGNKTLSRNLNSLFTLARVAPNAIEARLGAAWANGRFVMVPRTFNVTIILLVPTATKTGIGTELVPCPNVTFTSMTRMRDAEKGTLLPGGATRALDRQFRRLASNWELRYDEQLAPAYHALVRHAQNGDFEMFRTRLATIPTRGAAIAIDPMIVWNEFVALSTLTGKSRGTFQVPLQDSRFFDAAARGTLVDNGKFIELALNGAANILGDRISATLRIDRGKSSPLFLNSHEVVVGLDGRSAIVRFPSARPLLGGKEPERVFVSVRHEEGTRDWQTSSYTREWYPMRAAMPADQDDGETHPIGSRFCEEPIPYVFVTKSEP